jgi:hypothetical protein
MRTVQAVIAATLVVILTISLVAIGLSTAFGITFLRLEFYDEVFQMTQFYSQIRQWLFNRVNTELPNGHEALPYLEKVMTEHWLRSELLSLGGHLFDFLRGENNQLPIIPVHKLFEQLDNYMNEIQIGNKDKLINYWFGPIPERVRFQDIISVEFFWTARKFIEIYKWMSWGIVVLFFILFGLLTVITRGLRHSMVWLGASMAAAGGIMLETVIAANWILLYNGAMSQWAANLAIYTFPSYAIKLLLNTFTEAFLFRMNLMSFLFMLAGGFIITFCHFDKK